MTDTQCSLLIFQPDPNARKNVVSLIEASGFPLVVIDSVDGSVQPIHRGEIDGCLIAPTPVGREIVSYIRECTDSPVPIALLVDQEEVRPQALTRSLGADGFLRMPLTGPMLETWVSGVNGLSTFRRRARTLESFLAEAQGRLQRTRQTSPDTGFHHFEAVKDILVLEVRRAKRYAYPLALLMVGLDPVEEMPRAKRSKVVHEITSGLAIAIAQSIRVIDLPIHYKDNRILIFLPHTDLGGAEEVGRRIISRIKTATYQDPAGKRNALSASAGIAGIAGGEGLPFSRLIRGAAAALKVAQLKGGNRVIKRTSRVSGLLSDAGHVSTED